MRALIYSDGEGERQYHDGAIAIEFFRSRPRPLDAISRPSLAYKYHITWTQASHHLDRLQQVTPHITGTNPYDYTVNSIPIHLQPCHIIIPPTITSSKPSPTPLSYLSPTNKLRIKVKSKDPKHPQHACQRLPCQPLLTRTHTSKIAKVT